MPVYNICLKTDQPNDPASIPPNIRGINNEYLFTDYFAPYRHLPSCFTQSDCHIPVGTLLATCCMKIRYMCMALLCLLYHLTS
jgi:hypothetical protein